MLRFCVVYTCATNSSLIKTKAFSRHVHKLIRTCLTAPSQCTMDPSWQEKTWGMGHTGVYDCADVNDIIQILSQAALLPARQILSFGCHSGKCEMDSFCGAEQLLQGWGQPTAQTEKKLCSGFQLLLQLSVQPLNQLTSDKMSNKTTVLQNSQAPLPLSSSLF